MEILAASKKTLIIGIASWNNFKLESALIIWHSIYTKPFNVNRMSNSIYSTLFNYLTRTQKSASHAKHERNNRKCLCNVLFQTPWVTVSLTFSVSELLPQRVCCNRQHALYSPEENDVITFELKRGKLKRQTSDGQWASYTYKNLLTLLVVSVTHACISWCCTKITQNNCSK